MSRRTLATIEIIDVEKRRKPTKYYVYVFHIKWSNGCETVVYRRYSSIFDFHVQLLDKFPLEAGAKNPSDRIIPFLPGKKFLGRSQIKEVALKRLKAFNEYFEEFLQLPAKINAGDEVVEFFSTNDEDVEPIKGCSTTSVSVDKAAISDPVNMPQYTVSADYQRLNRSELTVREGDIVSIAEISHNGWWFVHTDSDQGWLPATYLITSEDDKKLQPTTNTETFMTTADYEAQNSDEVSFTKGQLVLVVAKNLIGWWKIRIQQIEGIAPAVYLRKIENDKLTCRSDPRPKRPPKPQNPPLNKQQQTPQVHTAAWRVKPLAPRYSIKRSQRGIREMPTVAPSRVEYMTITDFQSMKKGCLAFKAGVMIQDVIEQPSGTDWWFVRISGRTGWIPKQFLQRKEIFPDGKITTSLVQDCALLSQSLENRRDSIHYMCTDVVDCDRAENRDTSSGQRTVPHVPTTQNPQIPTQQQQQTTHQIPTQQQQQQQTPTQQQQQTTQQQQTPTHHQTTTHQQQQQTTHQQTTPTHQQQTPTHQQQTPTHRQMGNCNTSDSVIHSVSTLVSSIPDLSCGGCTSDSNLSYIAISDYTPIHLDYGVQLHTGDPVSLIQHSDTGWSYIESPTQKGWVPTSYITTDSSDNITNTYPSSKPNKPARPPPPKFKLNK